MTLDAISLFLGLIAGFTIAGLIAAWKITSLKKDLEHERFIHSETGNVFSSAAQQALENNNEQFLKRFSELAQEKMKQAKADGSHDLEKRQIAIGEMIKPIEKQLESLGSAVEQIKGTDKALREDLHSLSRETARLAGALKDPAAQGRWGEFILEGLLDKSGLIKGVHYDTQVSIQDDGKLKRPDAIIRLHDGFHIIVDAKAPLNKFADRLNDNLSADETKQMMQTLSKQIREHVKALGKKGYWESIDSPDFTVMFLPSEHLFSIALRTDPDIVDFAHDNNIVIASPTLMMSLLRVVGMSWRQVELAQNAQDISVQGAELYKRLTKFGNHLERVGKGIHGALNSYNAAIGSLQRMVIPAANRLKDLQGQNNTPSMPVFEQIEEVPRVLENNKAEQDETAKEPVEA